MKKSPGGLKLPSPPSCLGDAGSEMYGCYVALYAFDADALLTLRDACIWRDLEATALATVEKEGATFKDRFANIRPHPAVQQARDAATMKLKHLRTLNVDLEPLHAGPGRPGGR